MYAVFLKLCCVKKLRDWQKGEPEPEEIYVVLTRYQECAAARCEHGSSYYDNFQSVYFSLIYANRSEKLDLGERTLEEAEHALEIFNEKPDHVRNQQAFWIQFHEQKLYHALLKDDRECILETVEKVLNYPHRRNEYSIKKFCNIQKAYQETDHPDIDKHQMWDNIWF